MSLFLEGVWPACPTILTEDEKVDQEGMRRVASFLAERGVNGLWLLGGGGEGVLLADDVCREAVEVVLDEVGDRVPVVAGISAEGTRAALARYAALADLPVAGVFATPPYYYACNAGEIERFYRTLAAGIDKPVVVYNNPHAAKAGVDPATAARLAECEEIVAVKDSSGDFLVTQAFIAQTSHYKDFSVVQGYDQLVAASVLAGGRGAVTAVGCFAPELMLALTAAARMSDAERAFELQRRVVQLLDDFGWDPYSDSAFIRGVKQCLAAIGLCSAYVAEPFSQVGEDDRMRVETVMRELVGALR